MWPSLRLLMASPASSRQEKEKQVHHARRLEAWALPILLLCASLEVGTCLAAEGTSQAPSDMVINSVRREGVDTSLRRYAFLAVSQQEEAAAGGNVYNVTLAPILHGIESQALWLASATTLQQQGLSFNEFSIPQGAFSTSLPSDAPLLLIYRKIINFTLYSLPATYSFAGPVVGIIVYSPPNFTTDDPGLPQLSMSTSSPSISANVPLSLASAPSTSISCAFFSPNGSISFASLASPPNVCMSDTLGDVALVLPTQDVPSQEQQQQQQDQTPLHGVSPAFTASGKPSKHWKLALGATVLGLVGLGFCVVVAMASVGVVRRLKVAVMAHFTGNEEALQTSLIGMSRAPSAPGVRTKPALEMDMARF